MMKNIYNASGNINTVYPWMIGHIMECDVVPSKDAVTGEVKMTREAHPAQIVVEDPRRRLVTAYGRPVNVPFALAEVLWILTGRNDVAMLKHYNSNIASYSDDGETFNAAYGERLRSAFGHDQLLDVMLTLGASSDTRQATIVLSLPERDRGWKPDPDGGAGMVRHETKDRACNVLAHLMVRDGALDWYHVVRSNDALWGVPYNWMQWTHVQEYVATTLGLDVGYFVHNADSLHIYDRQWVEAGDIRHFDLYQQYSYEHALMEPRAVEVVSQVEARIRRTVDMGDFAGWHREAVGEYWNSVLLLLLTWRRYKDGDDDVACDLLLNQDADPVYGAATMRFFYYHRWYKTEHASLLQRLAESLSGSVYEWVTAAHASHA